MPQPHFQCNLSGEAWVSESENLINFLLRAKESNNLDADLLKAWLGIAVLNHSDERVDIGICIAWFSWQIRSIKHRPAGPMDKASAYEAEDSRFDPWVGRPTFWLAWFFYQMRCCVWLFWLSLIAAFVDRHVACNGFEQILKWPLSVYL